MPIGLMNALPYRAIRNLSIWLSRMDRIDAIVALEQARGVVFEESAPRTARRRAISVPGGTYRRYPHFGAPRISVRALGN